jgi:hypothetical protein
VCSVSAETATRARGAAAPADAWLDRWSSALAELQLEVDLAEALLASDHLPPGRRAWVPPTGLGPLPAPLRARAEALLERQTEVARRLAEAASLARRHASAVQVLRADGPARPVYVDTAG